MPFEVDSRLKRLATAGLVVVVCIIAVVFNFGASSTDLTEDEAAAIRSITGVDAAGFEDMTSSALAGGVASKFPAVDKVYRFQKLYAFIVKPVAYNGPITLAVVIDVDSDECVGMRIVEHVETKHYVRDMESAWFIGRFAQKSALGYLKLVRQQARDENEIVAITGATVTTEAIINGVNAAFGAYREAILQQEAESVPYMIKFDPGQGDGPVETGSIAIRAYGVVLAEISLEEIKALPSVNRTMTIQSSSGSTQHAFTGTLLSNVLDYIDPGLMESYKWALSVGVDDYVSDIGMDEIAAENNVFIMYEDNAEPLQKKNGEPGSMRVIVINDVFGQRFTNYLLEIVLENEAAY